MQKKKDDDEQANFRMVPRRVDVKINIYYR